MTDEQGDPVCWLSRLCPECGAMPSEESPRRCWRCGTPARDDVGGGAADPQLDG